MHHQNNNHEHPHKQHQPQQPYQPPTHEQQPKHPSQMQQVHTLLEWHAPGRPFKKRSKEFFINSFLIMMAVEVILFLFSQYLLMLVVFSFVFLSFALASIPPRDFHYRISSEGILVENNFFIWDELYDFYFFKHFGEETIHVGTKSYFPGELTLTLADIPAEDIKPLLLPYLPFREYMEPTFIEKASTWLERNFPLERNAR